MDREKLNGTNFLDWFRNLRIVLTHDKKLYVLDGPLPPAPARNATQAAKDAWSKHCDDVADVQCLMLATMDANLQRDLEFHKPYEMIEQLKGMFQQQAQQELHDTFMELVNCKLQEGSPVSPHVLKMKGLVERLERLGSPLRSNLATSLVLGSLPKSYSHFIMHFNMNGWEKPIMELHAMLVTAEKNIPAKTTPVLLVKGGQVKKPNAKGKGK